ncbi:MAG: hypothetical protein K2X49_16135 [Acetobacteraceae bacterium]|nr:hypothetical protein [Acetobacteraceae bacterium]
MTRLPTRRAILAAPPALLAARPARAALPVPLRFRILREGSAIGTHRVSFAEAGDGGVAAQIDVDIAVRLAGITVFRFTHRFQEVWRGARLVSVASRQDRNGTVTEMQARAEGDAIQLRGPDGAARLPAEAAPLSWWDVTRIEAQRPLFENSTGRLLRLSWTRTPLPGGGRRWRCAGDRDSAGDWAADGTWIGWTTKGDDGSTVTYERA